MFVVEIGAVMTTLRVHRRHLRRVATTPASSVQIALWLWFTVLFANFAEAIAEGRGKAQAQALRRTRTETSLASKMQGRPRRCKETPRSRFLPPTSARATSSLRGR